MFGYNGASLTPDLSGFFQGLTQDISAHKQKKQFEELSTAAFGDGVLDVNELIKLNSVDPKSTKFLMAVQQQNDNKKLMEIQQANAGAFNEATSYLNMEPEARRASLIQKAEEKLKSGGDASREMELLNMDDDQFTARMRSIQMQSGDFDKLFKVGALTQGKDVDKPAKLRTFEELVLLSKSEDEGIARAAQIELGMTPRAGSTSKSERLANDPEMTGKVAASEAEITAAKESARLKEQLSFKSKITASVRQAEIEAKERGQALSDLARIKAAKPALDEVVARLKDLAPIATSTMAGKAFDSVSHQFGFGATKGSTGRAKFIALIDNQVLPLLKQTFGAAFTEAEGRRLTATLGDPDAPAEEKIAQLDEFIAAKQREIEIKEREVNGASDFPIINSQQQYDALPSGAVFFEDGVKYRKP